MNTNELEKMKADLREEISRVNDALRQILADLTQSQNELADLEATLPKSLALFYLGSISKSEIAKVKKRRSELREFLDDYPFLSAGLKDQLTALGGRMNQLNAMEAQFKRYEALKESLRENPRRTDLENQLLGLGHELGCLPDAQKFLEEVNKINPIQTGRLTHVQN